LNSTRFGVRNPHRSRTVHDHDHDHVRGPAEALGMPNGAWWWLRGAWNEEQVEETE
jgi:hypothetical protein